MGRGRPTKCPHCSVAGQSIRKGLRRTKTMGTRRIRFCTACGKKFTPRTQRPLEEPVEELSDSVAEGPGELMQMLPGMPEGGWTL